MSDKETNRNETPWRARGFKKPFSGTKNFTYQEFVDANRSLQSLTLLSKQLTQMKSPMVLLKLLTQKKSP